MKKRSPAKKQEWQLEIAKKRIDNLFSQARERFETNPALAHRYVALARKIAIRFNIRLGRTYKRHFCRRCYHYLVPGANSRVRTNKKQKALIIKCIDCGHISRYPYRKER